MASATGRTASVQRSLHSRQAPLPLTGVVPTASHHRHSTPTAPYSRRASSRSPANRAITQKQSQLIEASKLGVSRFTPAGQARSLPRRSSRVGAEVPWTIPSVPSPEAPQPRVMQSPWPTLSPTPTGRRAEPRLSRAPSLKNARDQIQPQTVPFSPVAGEHFRDNDLSAYSGYGESAARTVAGAPTSPHQLIQSIHAAADLHDRGHLSIDEFAVLKQSVLAPVSPERTGGGGGGGGIASAVHAPVATAADLAAAVVAEVSTPLQTRPQNPAIGSGSARIRQSRDPQHGAPSSGWPSRLAHSSANPGGGSIASTPAPDRLMAANPVAVDVSQIGRSTPEGAAGPLAHWPINRTDARVTAVHARPGQFDIALPLCGQSLGFSVSWEDGRATIDSIKPGTMLDRPAMPFSGDFVISVHGSPITNAKMVMPLFARCIESGQLYMRIERRGHSDGEEPVAHTLVFFVRLSRSRQHLGLVAQAVKDAQTTQCRLVVAHVDPLGAAGRDGRLVAGDWIRQVNGVMLCADDQDQVQRLLSSAELELEVLRGAVPVA